MPFKCSVPGCRSNYKSDMKFSVFSFPQNEILREVWMKAMAKEDFKILKYLKVCELHFEPDQIIREASAFDPRTGRTLTARLNIPRLKKDAVPTLFMTPPPGAHVRSRSKTANKKKKNQPEESIVEEGTEETDESQRIQLLQNDSGTELQIVAEPSIVIKLEPVESTDSPSPLVIGNVLSAEDLALSSSSRSSPSTLAENAFPVADPDSTNDIESPVTRVSKKPSKRKKMNDAKPNVIGGKKRKLAKPSSSPKRNSRRVGTSKKSAAGPSVPPTDDAENATREMFQFLVNSSENRAGERPGDLFDVFADFIADKLRKMNLDNCSYALRAILDIVFKAAAKKDSEEDSEVSSSEDED